MRGCTVLQRRLIEPFNDFVFVDFVSNGLRRAASA